MVSDKVADVLNSSGGEFAHGLTYSGHPVACAVGIATIGLLKEEKIIENLHSNVADHFQRRWTELADHPVVGEARIKGMVAALEIVKDKSTHERLAPEAAGTVFCRDVAIANGLVVRAVADTIICAPPIICNTEEIDTLVDRLLIGLDATAKEYGVN